MGIGDYIWPFEKKFSKIPCAREASIAALLGGPGIGIATFAVTNKIWLAYKTMVYSGLVVLWISFGSCRIEYERQRKTAQQFKESVETGKLD